MTSCFDGVPLFQVFKHRVVADQPYFGTDHLLKHEVVRKACSKFIVFGVYSWDENSISSLICFGALITDTVDASFATNLGLNLNVDNVLDHVLALDSSLLQPVKRSSNRGGTTPQESSGRMKSFLPTTAANILFRRYFLFCANDMLSNTNRDLETSVLKEETTVHRLNNKSREHALFYWRPVTGQFYIASDMHSFNKYICDRIGNVYDCYILLPSSLDESFKPFRSTWPVELVTIVTRDQNLAKN